MKAAQADQLLAEARAIYATDRDRALALRRQVAESAEVSPAWSNARVDLAAHELGVANYTLALEHATVVLAAPRELVDAAARAVAGIVLAGARDFLDQPVDEPLLAESAEAAMAAGHPHWAGVGLGSLARLHLIRGDRAGSKQLLERAVAAYDLTDSALSAPGALLRLATLEHEDGNSARAIQLIASALGHLDAHPLAGQSGRVLRDKLTRLRDSIE